MANNQIALLAQAPVFDTPFEAQGKALQLKQLMNQGQLADIDMQTKRQALADDAIQRQAFTNNINNPEGRLAALASAPKLYQAEQKAQLEAAKTKAEAGHIGAQTADSQGKAVANAFAIHRDQINTVNDPQSAAAWVKAGFADPLMAPLLGRIGTPEQAIASIPTDPAAFQKWKMQAALASNEYVKHTSVDANTAANNATSIANTTANNATSRANNAAQIGVQRDRLAYDKAQPKGQIVQTDNGPVLVDPRTGTGIEVTGPDGARLAGVTKPLTEGQSKALLFGSRMREADGVLKGLAKEGTTTSVPGSRAPLIGGVVNALSSDNKQMLDQAKRDFMTAVLRRESGAAISNGEFDTADKQYFPQVGDSAKVIAQKEKNRELAINGILVEVPEKQRGALKPKAAAATPNTNAKGWALHTDASGNKAYVSPDGKSFEEVK